MVGLGQPPLNKMRHDASEQLACDNSLAVGAGQKLDTEYVGGMLCLDGNRCPVHIRI